MSNKKVAISVMAISYIVLMVMDVVLTLNFGELVEYLELNLVYPFIGIAGIIAVNLIIIAVVYLLYKKSNSPTTRFYYINLLVTICMTRIFVIYSNIKVLADPPTVQQAVAYAAQVTTTQKVAEITSVAWPIFIPYLIGIITFWIWSMDHETIIKKC